MKHCAVLDTHEVRRNREEKRSAALLAGSSPKCVMVLKDDVVDRVAS